MWELIRANKRKSVVLFVVMGTCLILLGYLIGFSLFPEDGGMMGILIAMCLWMFLSFVSYFSGDQIVLAISKAKPVTHDVHPQLFNIVEEMKISANLPYMPKVYIIPDSAPNAFATGIRPKKCAIAVTAGLLSKLNRDELQGVIAHEMSHIINRDVLYMTFAGIMLGSIILISHLFLRGLWYSGAGGRYRSRSSKGGGQAQMIIIIVTIIFAILAPILARLLYFAISRKREYLADASAVRLTRYPEGLANALEKISSSSLPLPSVNKVTAPMYIVSPLMRKGSKLSALSSTHPPIKERIRILRNMSFGVNYLSYQKAYSSIKGKVSPFMPSSGLKDSSAIPIRKPTVEKSVEKGAKTSKRDIGDLMMAANKYLFLLCVCGLKIKVPPDFKKPKISCPRCKREVDIPFAELAAVTAGVGAVLTDKDKTIQEQIKGKSSDGPAKYVRKGKGWETFSCSCGGIQQLSPTFMGTHLNCRHCGKKIEIV